MSLSPHNQPCQLITSLRFTSLSVVSPSSTIHHVPFSPDNPRQVLTSTRFPSSSVIYPPHTIFHLAFTSDRYQQSPPSTLSPSRTIVSLYHQVLSSGMSPSPPYYPRQLLTSIQFPSPSAVPPSSTIYHVSFVSVQHRQLPTSISFTSHSAVSLPPTFHHVPFTSVHHYQGPTSTRFLSPSTVSPSTSTVLPSLTITLSLPTSISLDRLFSRLRHHFPHLDRPPGPSPISLRLLQSRFGPPS